MSVTGRNIQCDVIGDRVTVCFLNHDIIDVCDADAVVNEIEEMIAISRPCLVILDFTNVRHMGSRMFGHMLHLQKVVQKHGGKLRVCAMDANIERTFTLCRLERIIPLFKTADEAAG